MVDIPPDDKLINQIANPERRTARSGRDSIDPPPCGGHDDRANVVAGLVAAAAATRSTYTLAGIGDDDEGTKFPHPVRAYL